MSVVVRLGIDYFAPVETPVVESADKNLGSRYIGCHGYIVYVTHAQKVVFFLIERNVRRCVAEIYEQIYLVVSKTRGDLLCTAVRA